ncbi:MAG: hypothetical protein E6Q97_08205 [Desulfurellales bacterium]|nr:MAG: hypothetical protein E6Q97_08205 [Desulfurellales bacterium]
MEPVNSVDPESETLTLDPNELTLGEGEEFEELTGVTVASIKPGAALPVKALTVLVYLIRRRTDPSYSLEDARKVRFAELPQGPKA